MEIVEQFFLNAALFPELSLAERGDSLTAALGSGNVEVLDRALAMGFFQKADAWHVSLAMRDPSKKAIRWLGEKVDWHEMCSEERAEFSTNLARFSNSSGIWDAESLVCLESVLLQAFGDFHWIQMCESCKATPSSYWSGVVQRKPWLGARGGARGSRAKAGEFGSWRDVVAALSEGDAEEAAAADAIAFRLISGLGESPESRAKEIHGDLLRAAANRLFSGRKVGDIAKSIQSLPAGNIQMGRMGELVPDLGKKNCQEGEIFDILTNGRIMEYARPQSGAWRAAPHLANVGFLVLMLGGEDELRKALAAGWIDSVRLDGGILASPITMLARCEAAEFMRASCGLDPRDVGKFKALLEAGFNFEGQSSNLHPIGDWASSLSSLPEVLAMCEGSMLEKFEANAKPGRGALRI